MAAEIDGALRSRMEQRESVIYVASANAVESKWILWELGAFDDK